MLGDRSFLAVVPARGGSKGVVRKNVRMLGGMPLLMHTLRQIAAVPEIDCAVVSSDDAEIAEVAVNGGAEIVRRPTELATDEAPTEWALLHVLDVLAAAGRSFDYIVVLEPTSPFRSAETIRRCMTAITEKSAESLMTVVETRSNLGRLENGTFQPLVPGAPRRRQDREPFYIESSTVYVCLTDYLQRTGSLVSQKWMAVTIPEAEALDINTEEDLRLAECVYRQR